MKKFLIAAASLATLAAPMAASAQPYGHGGYNQAQRGGDYGRGYERHDGNAGAAVAAGLFGLVLGAALASNSHPEYDRSYDRSYGRSYGYDQPYEYRTGYNTYCRTETQAYRGWHGRVDYRQVQVCR